MRLVKPTLHVVYLLLFSFFTTHYVKAQSPFREGVLTYKADTIKRLVSKPSKMYISQMRVYIKGQLARHDIISISGGEQRDTIRTSQIRNEQGIYICLDPSSQPEKVAILMSYKEEQEDKANRMAKGNLSHYTVKKTGQHVKLLGVNTERVLLKGDDKTNPLEVSVSTDINVPVGLFYESLSQIKGTPLQFTEEEDDWLYQYTIEAIESQPLSKQIFEVDPKFMIIPMKMFQEMGKTSK